MLPLFCNCLLAGISLLIKPPIKISSKDNTGSSAASSARRCWSWGDIDESLSPAPRVYQISALALRGRRSLQGLGDVSPPKELIKKRLFGQHETGR